MVGVGDSADGGFLAFTDIVNSLPGAIEEEAGEQIDWAHVKGLCPHMSG
jgi:hypothetical protein